MTKVIIARYGEVHLKGANRGYFLKALQKNIENRVGQKIKLDNSRFVIDGDDEKIAYSVAEVFGITSVSIVTKVESIPEKILEYLKTIKVSGTYKVEVNRADKKFPHKSPDFARMCGGAVDGVVDVVNPDTRINIDIRENGTFVYDKIIPGVGGLPVGTAGHALVLLSGGIDSPVASWLAAKRGLSLEYIHFYSPPYTSAFALDKVKRLASKLEKYCGRGVLHIVPFTQIQDAIRNNCDEEYLITIMRRFMVRIAERLAMKRGLDCIVTGENLAQVASQTIQSLASNDMCMDVLPVLRPIITYDKAEIVKLSKQIGTYETSIEPHLDCCTVFIPRHPMIKPNIKKVEEQEKKLQIDELIENAMNNIMV